MTNSKNSRIDANYEKNEKVEKEIEKSCVIVIVSRDKRENEIDCFDREIISVHDIGFLDVLNDVIDFFDVITDAVNDAVDAEETTNFIEVDENEELEVDEIDEIKDDDIDDIDDTNVENADKDETNEINEVVNV